MKITETGVGFTLLKQDLAMNSIFVIECRCKQNLSPKKYLSEIQFINFKNITKTLTNWVLNNPYQVVRLDAVGLDDYENVVCLFFELEKEISKEVIKFSLNIDENGYVNEIELDDFNESLCSEDQIYLEDIFEKINKNFTKKSSNFLN